MSTEERVMNALAIDLKNRYDVLDELVQNMNRVNQQLEETMERFDSLFPDDDSEE